MDVAHRRISHESPILFPLYFVFSAIPYWFPTYNLISFRWFHWFDKWTYLPSSDELVLQNDYENTETNHTSHSEWTGSTRRPPNILLHTIPCLYLPSKAFKYPLCMIPFLSHSPHCPRYGVCHFQYVDGCPWTTELTPTGVNFTDSVLVHGIGKSFRQKSEQICTSVFVFK